MSIINEALKKAEKEKKSSSLGSQQIFNKLDEFKTDARRSLLRRWLIWTGTGAVCLLGVILAANSFKKPFQPISLEKTADIEVPATDIEAPLSIFQSEIKDAAATLTASPFRLNGILYDKEKPLAIINGHIVEENALINGAKLLEIQPNYVRLSFKEKELTLKLK